MDITRHGAVAAPTMRRASALRIISGDKVVDAEETDSLQNGDVAVHGNSREIQSPNGQTNGRSHDDGVERWEGTQLGVGMFGRHRRFSFLSSCFFLSQHLGKMSTPQHC